MVVTNCDTVKAKYRYDQLEREQIFATSNDEAAASYVESLLLGRNAVRLNGQTDNGLIGLKGSRPLVIIIKTNRNCGCSEIMALWCLGDVKAFVCCLMTIVSVFSAHNYVYRNLKQFIDFRQLRKAI